MGFHVGAAPAAAPRPFLAYGYRAGRVWHTDFSTSAYDDALFDITGFDRVTDGSTPALQLTTPGTGGSVLLKDHSIRDVDVRAKFKMTVAGGFSLPDTQPFLLGRYLDMDNCWRLQASFDPGNPIIQGHSLYAGADQSTGGSANPEITNVADYRYMRMRVVEDLLLAKSWIDGDPEPDWQIKTRLRPMANMGGFTDSTDNVDVGSAGLWLRYTDSYFTELVITELVRTDDSLLLNSDCKLLDNNGIPAFWAHSGTVAAGNTLSVETIPDRNGVTRNVFQIDKAVSNPAASLGWTHRIFSVLHQGPGAHVVTRKRPHPQVAFPRAMEVSCWSKGQSVALHGGTLGATIVAYYYDKEGNALNIGDPTYYSTLGPNGAMSGAGGKGGDGTWDWTPNSWRFDILNFERVQFMDFLVCFHDDLATGTFQVVDLYARPIP